MKRRITEEQLNQLNDFQKQKIMKWWIPQVGDVIPCGDGEYPINHIETLENGFMCFFNRHSGKYSQDTKYNFGNMSGVLPLLDMGHMFKFLNDHLIESCQPLYMENLDNKWYVNNGQVFESDEPIDALWEAVKHALR